MLTLIDIRTLMLVSIVVLISRALVLAYFWRVEKKYPPIRYWVSGSALTALGIIMVALRGLIPDFVSIILGQALILPGWMLIDAGIVVAADRKPPWQMGMLICLFALISSRGIRHIR